MNEAASKASGEMILDERDLVVWVRGQASAVERYLFGIAGPPGCGKSTVANRLGAELGAPVVPMDGFHLPNDTLRALSLLGTKGAPATFASNEFVDLVRSLRTAGGVVRCPTFDRTVDEPVADRIEVHPDDAVVIIEGNYLLLDQLPWSTLPALFDAVVYLEVPADVRFERLVARHVEFGRHPTDAASFARRSDGANADLVEACRDRGHLIVVRDVTPGPTAQGLP